MREIRLTVIVDEECPERARMVRGCITTAMNAALASGALSAMIRDEEQAE